MPVKLKYTSIATNTIRKTSTQIQINTFCLNCILMLLLPPDNHYI